MTQIKKHSKAYWIWRRFRAKLYDIPSFFVYLFYHLPRNYYLVKRYPFLKPCQNYYYESTWLDGMPIGWRKAFGLQICREIQEVIDRDHITNYSISQVKEKFGGLRWYDSGGNQAIRDIIRKYEVISAQTCMICGRPAEYVTTGWKGCYCGKCIKNFRSDSYTKTIKES